MRSWAPDAPSKIRNGPNTAVAAIAARARIRRSANSLCATCPPCPARSRLKSDAARSLTGHDTEHPPGIVNSFAIGLTRTHPPRSPRSIAGASRIGSGKAARGLRAGFRSFNVAITQRGSRDERVEELPYGLRHLVHGTSESDFVGLGGPRKAAQLSDE